MKRRIVSGSRTTTDQRAFNKILVAVDSPEGAEEAADLALTLAALNHAEVVMVHVENPPVPGMPALGAGVPVVVPTAFFMGIMEEEKRVRRWMTRFTWMAEEKGIKSKSVTLPADRPVADHLTKVAEEESADLIITGTNGRRGLERLVMGSVSSDVTRKAKCPVLVVH